MAARPVEILLVEDSPSDAALLQEGLTQDRLDEFKFTHVETLAQALVRITQASFDVVLLDLSLPDSTGRDTFLKARAQAPHLPIVVLTGMEDEATSLEAVRHGIQDYLIKGQAYGRQTVRAIRHAIERKRIEEALKQAEAALQLERSQLESRVRARTAELSESNRALQEEISQRHRAEAAHQQVLLRLSQVEETERAHVSRELHDQLGQNLSALKLGIQLLRKQGLSTPEAPQRLAKLEALADGLLQDIHRLAWELRPSTLDDLGLNQALRRYTSTWSENTSVPVDFHGDGLDSSRLPTELETTLYRVAQEALTNVARHAKAHRVSVLFERRPSQVSLIVEDDGRGFDAEAVLQAPDTQGKLGLLGMFERASLVGGSVEIESSPGHGTSVFVRLPLREPGPGQAARNS